MNEISPISNPHAALSPLPPRIGTSGPAGAGSTAPGDDRVELSQLARLRDLLDQGPVREDLIAEVRGQIDAGTYDSEAKFNAAIEKLIDDI